MLISVLKVMNSVTVLLVKVQGWFGGQEGNDKESFPLVKSCNSLQTLLNSSAVNKNRDSVFRSGYKCRLITVYQTLTSACS